MSTFSKIVSPVVGKGSFGPFIQQLARSSTASSTAVTGQKKIPEPDYIWPTDYEYEQYEDLNTEHHAPYAKWALKYIFSWGVPASVIYAWYGEFFGHNHNELPDKPYPWLFPPPKKDLPWGSGKNALFHNPKLNRLTDGSIDEEGIKENLNFFQQIRKNATGRSPSKY